ncbi:MAG: LTA synthase family protein [Oscillospiraceae bacterium]|nr:LTA synthase family protein [Oscillospiraceae bacterium]
MKKNTLIFGRIYKHDFIRTLYFPFLAVWLELILHIYMQNDLKYMPIYILFGISFGLVIGALTSLLKGKAAKWVSNIISFLMAVVFGAEFVAKVILQEYYGVSILGTAAENHLEDYADKVYAAIGNNILILLLMLLPPIVFFFFTLKIKPRRSPYAVTGAVILAAAFHIFARCDVSLIDWKTDYGPAYYYGKDTGLNEQVEQLGLITMLRQDVQHIFKPAEGEGLIDDGPGVLPTPVNPNPGSQGEPVVPDNPDVPVDPGSPVNPDEPTPAPVVVDRSPNVLNVDLVALASESKNKDIKDLANYFNNQTPTNKNEYTGMFEGYNVIFITIEGFSGYAVDPVLTPTLYKMQHEGFYFTNFYTALHYTSTSNGECQHLLGLYPKDGNPISMKRSGEVKMDAYFSLAQQLGREGYINLAYHNNENNLYGRAASHSNLGYDYRYMGHGMGGEYASSGKMKWPQRDTYMVDITTDDYMTKSAPFNVYYMTISGHTPYSWNWVANQYKDRLASYSWSEKTKAYMAISIEVDNMMALLLERLEAAGKLDNTLIIAAPDHIPYSDTDILDELAGKSFGANETLAKSLSEKNLDTEIYRSCAIIWSHSMKEPVVVDKVTCQVDLLPTVSNLLGLKYDSRMLAGKDALSEDEGMVIFHSKSWRTDSGFYNSMTQTFTPAPGVTMTKEEQEEYVSYMKKVAANKLNMTAKIIENDFYAAMRKYIR